MIVGFGRTAGTMERASRPGTQARPRTQQRGVQRGFYSEIIGNHGERQVRVN